MGKSVRLIILVIGVLIAILVAATGMDYSIHSNSCELCHRKEAGYSRWLITQKGKHGFSHDQVACADCHFEGASERLLSAKIKGVGHVIRNIVPLIDPREEPVKPVVEKIPAENCRHCHRSFDKIDEMDRGDLPVSLKEIGLAMGHRKHYETANNECATCHVRSKMKEGKLQADKGVNYREYSHMTCDSCHRYVAHAYKKFEGITSSNITYDKAFRKAWVDLNKNTRWKVDIPSEESCRRCHQGKFHFQKMIFLADRIRDNNYTNCLRCHPSMTPEFFNSYKEGIKGSRIQGFKDSSETPEP